MQMNLDRTVVAGDDRTSAKRRELLDVMQQLYTLREEMLERLIEKAWQDLDTIADVPPTP